MTRVAERQLVLAPLASAARLLAAYFAANAAPDGTGARIVLHAAEFNAAAIVTVTPVHAPADMTPHYTVHWESESNDPYPVFDGRLTVEADNDYNSFWLKIDGSYEPPAGLAGKLFDTIVGHRLAEETTRNLLASIRDAVQTTFQSEEAAKRKTRHAEGAGA